MKFLTSFAMALLLLPAIAQANCGSAFCSFSTDWDVQGLSQSMSNKTGVRLDLRAEYINQDQLRKGSNDTSPAGEVDEHDELRTINRNYLVTLDWNINPDWGVTFKLPFIDRAHKHVHNEDDGAGGIAPELEKWDFSGIGDVQALARYRYYHDADSNAGLRFGLKLPTGSIRKSNGLDRAERMLQPGTGSVDTVLGAYYNKRAGKANWFLQGQWQQAVIERDNFKPGRKLSLDTGLSYNVTPDFSLLLQLNAQHKSKDSGSNAEPAESGGYTIGVSPGASYRVTPNVRLYGFVQTPIMEHVNGTQLTADWSAAVGISTQF
jgi:Putative MetA-pathway of phenol degradation